MRLSSLHYAVSQSRSALAHLGSPSHIHFISLHVQRMIGNIGASHNRLRAHLYIWCSTFYILRRKILDVNDVICERRRFTVGRSQRGRQRLAPQAIFENYRIYRFSDTAFSRRVFLLSLSSILGLNIRKRNLEIRYRWFKYRWFERIIPERESNNDHSVTTKYQSRIIFWCILPLPKIILA